MLKLIVFKPDTKLTIFWTLSSVLWFAPLWLTVAANAEPQLKIATFQADVTPPIGSPLCCEAGVKPAETIVDPLSARGIILLGASKPIVLVAVDWTGIANTGWDEWRAAIAKAAGTDIDHVSVNTLHQHDAPEYDPDAERIVAPLGLAGKIYNVTFMKEAIRRTAAAVHAALAHATPVTHIGFGKGKVEQVASNRRVIGADGKVLYWRSSATKDPKARAEPEGTIDPYVRLISFWQGEKPLVSMTFYTTHPQSYYGQGGVSADFIGMARAMREAALPGVVHIHFNGASGNVAAGKYNDGATANRPILAKRVEKGMREAWESTVKQPIRAKDIRWDVLPVALPPAESITDEAELTKVINDPSNPQRLRLTTARNLAFERLCKAGRKIPLFRLSLANAEVVFVPGELFVEYQLAAEQLKPNQFIAMVAYGDYGPGYIGTAIAYQQGGYEVGTVSRTSPKVDAVLTGAIREIVEK